MAVILPNGKQSFSDAAGAPLVGGKLYTYAAGTNVLQGTWKDANKVAGNTNPIILDARGEATIFWDGAYKIVLTDALGNLIWPAIDNIYSTDPSVPTAAALAASGGSSLIGFIQSGAGAVTRTAQSKMREVISSSDFATLAQAMAEAVVRGVPLLINSNMALAANTVSTVTLIAGGGIITTGAFTLTVKRIIGDEQPLFDAAGTGAVTISDNSESLLGWFSPVADGVTEDTTKVTRWLGSSKIRATGLVKTILTDTVAIPTFTTASRVSGAGMALTQFKSKTGADIFTLPGVNVAGLNYVNFLTMGGMTFIGQGAGVGGGYGVHVPGTVSTGYSNEFYDMDSTLMGGGTFKDEPGLFSTTWINLRGGEGGDHVFNMSGSGPGSEMVGCYPRNALAGKAGFRLYNSNTVLRDCNGLNVDSADKSCWAICGQSTVPIVINVTTGGSFTIPAGASQIPGNTVFENCNIESFPDIAIVSINGPPRIDNKTTFQTRVDSGTCIAVYCPDNLGSNIQGTLPPINQIALVGTTTWANNCPVWSQNSGAIFRNIPGDEVHQTIPIWAITDAAIFTYAATFGKYIGSLLTAFAVKHFYVGGVVRFDGLQATASYANDAAAAAGGVSVGQLYRNGSVVQIRIV
jgi:hypothetical protein